MSRGIGQWLDDLQLLDDRAGPSVQDDERQRVVMLRADVDEMDVQPVDLGDEVRQSLQPRLALAPVVLCRPVARERLHRRQPRALRLIFDGLLLGPARRRDAAAEVDEFLLGNVDVEGADCVVFGRCVQLHGKRGGKWAGRCPLGRCLLSQCSSSHPCGGTNRSSGSAKRGA